MKFPLLIQFITNGCPFIVVVIIVCIFLLVFVDGVIQVNISGHRFTIAVSCSKTPCKIVAIVIVTVVLCEDLTTTIPVSLRRFQ